MLSAIVPGEEERILEHDAELAAVRAELELAQVVAVDADRAVVRVVEAPHELRRGRLAAARLADEREAAAGRDVEVDPVQHRLAAVGERDVVDPQVALDREAARRSARRGYPARRRAPT